MKSDEFYRGNASSKEYEEHGIEKVNYPRKNDFYQYKVLTDDGLLLETSDQDLVFQHIGTTYIQMPSLHNRSTSCTHNGKDFFITLKFNETAHTILFDNYKKFKRLLNEEHKQDVIAEHFVGDNDEIADLIYSEAWERGHSGGFNEVESNFIELAEFAERILDIYERSRG